MVTLSVEEARAKRRKLLQLQAAFEAQDREQGDVCAPADPPAVESLRHKAQVRSPGRSMAPSVHHAGLPHPATCRRRWTTS